VRPDTPIQSLKGVGKGRADALAAVGMPTVGDLLYYFPYRYEDRRHPTRIADLGRHLDEPVLIRGKVNSARAHVSPVKRMKLFEAVFDDGTGAVNLIWFNQAYLAEQIGRDDRLSVYGIPRYSSRGLQIESPDWEKFEGDEEEEGAVVPIYSKIGTIHPKALRQIIARALDEALPELDDPLPPDLRQRLGVIDLVPAIAAVHRPAELDEAFLRQRSPAHMRLILQEFFSFMLALRVRRSTEEVKKKERRIAIDDAARAEVKRILPFRLTAAQKRVTKEIADDLRDSRPMYRLLQGDVGSGKTIVALIAAMIVIRNGHQAALLAPTEILAEQHYQRIRQLLDHTVVVAKATGSMSAGERRTLLSGLREGYIQLVVGTHAILEERVKFRSLGLAIVDEQHRFGVEQRQALFAKGETPDILVMTATPIPRSLALAMYGDLELSVIDELPPGRQTVKTVLRTSSQLDRVWKFMDDAVAGGAQAYVVHPIIEESEKLNLKPLTAGFESMKKRFPSRRVAMLHGRMTSDDKQETMQKFKRGEIDILVSTTVIEVGIDVPNASMMVILDADHFGLSQMHQLRGRVGRGERKSYCVVVCEEKASPDALERLKMFEKTKDGFDVAERDLEIRGPGEFLGTKQSGVPRFRFGNIVRDHALLEKAQRLAIELIEKDGLPRAMEVLERLIGVTIASGARD
jgi:ATP-dependent DNA helicase RecG